MTKPASAVVVQRVAPNQSPDTDEIISLAESAGYDVAATITQARKEDANYHVGSGKVSEVNHELRELEVETVIFDNELTPYQKYNLGLYFPMEVTVLDRYSLILDIFEQRATTKKAQLQVELARLRYELPRVEIKQHLAKRDERPGFMGLGDYDDDYEADLKNRIRRLKEKLDTIEKKNQHRREERRDHGFDIVALAGYTNAGKSTLMQRLAEDIEVGENKEKHPDLPTTAEATDRLFETLDTTTRRMEFDKRDVLLTDTVGFISDTPHWLLESFSSTLDSVYRADLVLLVADLTDSVLEIREKLVNSHDTLATRNDGPILTVFTKADAVTEEEIREKTDALDSVAPNPVVVSAESGNGIDRLKERLHHSLPPFEEERLNIPLTEESMRLISLIHDESYVLDTTYTGESATIHFEAKPEFIQRVRSKATSLTPAVD